MLLDSFGVLARAALVSGALLWTVSGCASLRSAPTRVRADEAARLVADLQSPDPAVWVPASLALEKLRGRAEPAIPGLCAILADERQSPEARSRAGIALTHFGAPAVEPMSQLLGEASLEVPLAATRVLGELGDVAAVGPLVSFLREPRGVVEAARRREQERLSDDDRKLLSVLSVLSLLGVPDKEIAGIRDDIELGIRSAVEEAARGARAQAVRALSHLKSPSTSKQLLRLLSDKRAAAEARAAAASALGALRDHQAVPQLLRSLEEEAPPLIRAAAAAALGDIGDGRAAARLEVAVRDTDSRVREAATKSLEKIGAHTARAVEPREIRSPETVDLLVKVLADRSATPAARRQAAEALGVLGDARAVGPLIKALAKGPTVARAAAAKSLGLLRDLRAVEPLAQGMNADSYELRRNIAEALGRIRGSQALAFLSEALQAEKEPYVRSGIIDALFSGAWSGERSTPLSPFLAALADKEGIVHEAAAVKLSLVPDGRKVEMLLRLLREPRVDLHRHAVRALKGSARDPRVVSALTEDLKAADPVLRRAAAETLGEKGNAGAVEALIALLGAEDRPLAAAAARALGTIGDRRAEAPLLEAISDRRLDVGPEFAEAFLALNRAPPAEMYVAALRVPAFQERAAEALAKIGEPAAPLLRAALEDADPVRRAGAARALGRIGVPEDAAVLTRALEDPDAGVRAGAMEGLARLDVRGGSEDLAAALLRGDPDTRRRAALALRAAGAPKDADLLRRALTDSDPVVRKEAVRYLGEQGETEVLVAALDDDDEQVRETAVWKLRTIGAPAVERLIAGLAKAPPRARALSARALAEIRDGRAVEALTAALDDAAAEVRMYAVYALKIIGDPQPMEKIIAKLSDADADVRTEAVYALVKFKDPRGLDPLLRALGDPSTQVVAAAAGSLCVFRDLRAVDPLILRLEHRNRQVREGAATTLGCLGDQRAVGPLLSYLRKASARETPGITYALTRITGEDFGLATEKWHSWWEQTGKR